MEKVNKKKVIIATVAIAVIAVGASAAAILLHNPLKLQKETVNVEFGQKISTDAKDYLAKDVDKDIVKKTKVSYKKNPAEGQEYDKIGKYTLDLKYGDKTKQVIVEVADTTAPEFNATAEIDTIEGVDLDFTSLITATDLSGATVDFKNMKDVNLKVAGEYTLKAVAKDKAGNKAKKDIKIKVAAKPANMTGSDVSVDPATGKVSVKANTYAASDNTGTSTSGGGNSYNNGYSSSASAGSGGKTVIDDETTSSGTTTSGVNWEAGGEFVWPDDWN